MPTEESSGKLLDEATSWAKEHKTEIAISVGLAAIGLLGRFGLKGIGNAADDTLVGGASKSLAAESKLLNTEGLTKQLANKEAGEPALSAGTVLSKEQIYNLPLSELSTRITWDTATKVGPIRDRLIVEDFYRPFAKNEIDIHTFNTLTNGSSWAMRSLPQRHVTGRPGLHFVDDWSVRPIGTKQMDWEAFYASRRHEIRF